MYRLLKVVFKIGVVVAAAFAFTLLMIAGAVGKSGLPTAVLIFCAYLTRPGVRITDWLYPLGGNFFSRILFFNTLIYSVLFGLLLWLFTFITKPLP
jgi:hypothetical protein